MKCLMVMVFVLGFCSRTVYAQQGSDEIARRLKTFYSWYMTENDKDHPNRKAIKDTVKKYCAASFLKKKRDDKELDYDPIVHAQDFSKEFVKTLKVAKLADGNPKKYCVSYWYEYIKNTDSIIVYLSKEGSEWKIAKTCREGNCY